MASNALQDSASFSDDRDAVSTWEIVKAVLQPLASLKLTVVLFALAIFLVFVGTLAQVQQDIWEVVHGYFRCWFAWVDFQIFFPQSFFPSKPEVGGGFYFPGGWLIGGAMFINLLAAHAVRFKVQAKGTRLWAGLGVIGLGVVVTTLVILSGSNEDGLQGEPMVSWSAMWASFKVALIALWLVGVGAVLGMPAERKLERRALYGGLAALAVLICWLLWSGNSAVLADASLRILWQLVKGTFAGVVLLVGCIMAFKKRGGIVLLHGGVGLLMAYEIFVGLKAVEAQMTIREGETTTWAQDIRTVELAVVDTSPADRDDVVVVPERFVTGGDIIQDSQLPFDIEVVEYMKNSSLRRAGPVEPNKADSGLGKSYIAEPVKASTGTDTDSQVDQPAAYIRFLKKGTKESLGVHLVSLVQSLQDLPEQVEVEGKTYDAYLRFKRMYKDYSIELIDVRKDDYLGTDTPKDYSSDVRLIDQRTNLDEKKHIWMNNPLRYSGETFYQSSYHKDPQTNVEMTTLSVVTNSGWMAPYVACMIVAVGLLAQFWQTLARFITRQQSPVAVVGAAAPGGKLPPPAPRYQTAPVAQSASPWNWIVPAIVVLMAGMYVVSLARPARPQPNEMNLYAFGQLPLVYEGRVKPFDTLARNTLLVLSDRQSYRDENNKSQPAIKWLLDVIADPVAAKDHKVFRIENAEVQKLLGLPRRDGNRYAIGEFADKGKEFDTEVRKATEMDEDKLDVFQRKLLELAKNLHMYRKLQDAFSPLDLPADADPRAIVQAAEAMKRGKPPLAVPMGGEKGTWLPFATALKIAEVSPALGGETDPATVALARVFYHYTKHDVEKFNSSVEEYNAILAKNTPSDYDAGKTRFEAYFNHIEPFYHAAILYLMAFLLTCFSWIGFRRPLNYAALALIGLTFLVHTWAIWGRMYISGRPPVTNLYSSAVFIGWGMVLMAICIEAIFRISLGNVIGAVCGAITLGIAHFLAADGDTFTVLQAVLDTQFWLATHVTCITLGYSATGLAGFLGVAYIVAGLCSPVVQGEVRKVISRVTYGILCFAIFFSFVGTVLGGLWADDSWGRFWGWDPKENGALIIVLWNALVLHARWGGMVKERGLAILTTAGLIAVSWSWFGVNELNIGLHQYGPTEGRLKYLGLFVGTMLCVMAAGSLPKSLWWSYKAQPEPTGKP
ncbi:MAG: cytochrome c biogenesis protein CcsA [Pirellulales bacterium]